MCVISKWRDKLKEAELFLLKKVNENMCNANLREKGAFIYYLITEGEGGSLKCVCMIMGEGEGGWPYDDIKNNYLLHMFVITIASIHFHGFPLDLSPVISGVSLIFINVNNC